MANGRITVEFVGAKELVAQLRAMEAAVAGQALETAAVAGALLVANAAKADAPYKTGTLRRSIHVGGHGDKTPEFAPGADQTPYGDVGGNVVARDHAEVLVGTDVPYGRRVEMGFSGPDALGRVYHQPGRPYLRPAFDGQQAAVVKEVGEALAELLLAAGGVRS